MWCSCLHFLQVIVTQPAQSSFQLCDAMCLTASIFQVRVIEHAQPLF